MGWTEAQKQAIETDGCHMLVSAAAGSGKTAVLTERILRKITEGMDIDRMLIMTFTRLAATEMRERIGKAIADRLDRAEGDVRHLYRQQALLSRASICTIDSFCHDVVMKNFTVSGVDASFSVGEANELELLERECLEELLEQAYQESKPAFLLLADLFADRSDDGKLEEIILKLYHFIEALPDPEAWLNQCGEQYTADALQDFGQTVWGKTVLEHIAMESEELAAETERLLKTAQLEEAYSYEKTLLSDLELFEAVKTAAESGSWKTAYHAVCERKFAAKARASREENAETVQYIRRERDRIKRSFNAFYALFGANDQSAFEDMRAVRPMVSCLISLVKDFTGIYAQKKAERRVMSFADMSHKALEILRIPEIASAYREQYLEIYLDEYQDTNRLQEAIIQCFAGENNIFMVGDVKQSIYAFRQACPEFFLEKERSFTRPENRQTGENCLVELSTNFRSRQEVISSVNQIFQKIMHERTCGTDYGERQRLNYGAAYYDPFPGDFQSELLLCGGGLEAECDMIADRIKNLMASGFLVYDKELGAQRPLRYGDIVILCRGLGGSSGTDMKERLLAGGIPAYVPEKGGFFSYYDVHVILSYIGIIDNPLQDIPLLTVLRSPLGGFDDNDLARIRIHDRNSLLFESMQTMDDERVRGFLETLAQYRREAQSASISQFIWKLMTETGYYAYVGAGTDGAKRQANLRMLFGKAVAFEKNGRKGFFRFINHISRLQQQDAAWDAADDLNGGMDVVRITTIHQSKGLEYPVVFLARCGSRLGGDSAKTKMCLSAELGIGLFRYEPEQDLFRSTMMNKSIQLIQKRKEMAEEMRILYVAMTRAREKLIVTAAVNDPDKCAFLDNKLTDYGILYSNRYLDWFLAAGNSDAWQLCRYQTTDGKETEILSEEMDRAADPALGKESAPRSRWHYPHERDELLPAKLSVSEIKRRVLEPEISEPDAVEDAGQAAGQPLRAFLESLGTESEQTACSPTKTGTLLHTCLEHIDFERCRIALRADDASAAMKAVVSETVSMLSDRGYILPEEAAYIDPDLPTAYLLSDIGRRMLESGEIRREVPFTILKEAGEIQPGVSGRVTVQGIIDCCFKEDGQFVLVDYKSDRVFGDELLERAEGYKLQLSLYAEALERITGIPVKEKILFFLRNKTAVSC